MSEPATQEGTGLRIGSWEDSDDANRDVLDEVGVIDQVDFDRVAAERSDGGEDRRPTAFLSSWLRQARLMSEIDLTRVALLCNIEKTRLRRLELGAVRPEAEELERLCALYGADIDRVSGLLPRLPARARVVDGVLEIGPAQIVVGRPNLSVLTDIADQLRQMRGLPAGGVVRIRTAELGVIGSVLDLDCDDVVTDLMTTFALNATEAVDLLTKLFEAQTDRARLEASPEPEPEPV